MTFIDNCIAITLCINYSDYLKNTLETNLKKFRKIVIITEKKDINTIDLVKNVGQDRCELFFTDRKKRHCATFNKSAMIRHAQRYIHKAYPKNWICLIDADTEIPLSVNIDTSSLNIKKIYGMNRYIYKTYDDYILNNGILEEQPKNVIGYVQLYYDKDKMYPRNSYNCAGCDIEFARMFDDEVQLPLIKGFYCKHLGETLVNWNGRKADTWKITQ